MEKRTVFNHPPINWKDSERRGEEIYRPTHYYFLYRMFILLACDFKLQLNHLRLDLYSTDCSV